MRRRASARAQKRIIELSVKRAAGSVPATDNKLTGPHAKAVGVDVEKRASARIKQVYLCNASKHIAGNTRAKIERLAVDG